MNGRVDEQNRALIDLEVRRALGAKNFQVAAWIDTAFNGYLVFPSDLIQSLQLEALAESDAILANGALVRLRSFVCYLDWFGTVVAAQVIANEGEIPLLGTVLLDNHVLRIDYRSRTLSLE